jgi:Flp pilus assembly protein CpaB
MEGAVRLARRVRIVLATRPVAYWSLALVVAAATALVVQRTAAGAGEERRRWGRAQAVLVATRPVPAGAAVEGALALAERPLAMIPDAALTTLPASGTVAAAALSRGEIVTRPRLGRSDRSAVASLLAPGRRGVAVPVDERAPPLQIGDVVDVMGPAGTAAHGAGVVHVGERAVVVAVAAEEAPAVARILGGDAVVLALVP